MNPTDLIAHALAPHGGIPNNPQCPLLVYPGAVAIEGVDPAVRFEDLFEANDWPPAWRDGVFPFHHFHSSAHEVLGVYSGRVTVLFGGEQGVQVQAGPGDVIVVPAGVAHKRVARQGNLGVVGAYPRGQSADLCRPGNKPCAREASRVASVTLPGCDPVFGAGGPLCERWVASVKGP